MTYFGVLAAFLLPPLALLIGWSWFTRRSEAPGSSPGLYFSPVLVIVIQVVLAVGYTTPWDNYLVAQRVWWYDPALVTGLTIGWVPVEEYTFFILQTLLTGLWALALVRIPAVTPSRVSVDHRLRVRLTAFTAAAWGASVGLLAFGEVGTTYLGLILSWALLPVLVQVVFGGDLLWGYRTPLVLAVSVPTLYLWAVDAIAIRSGTWTISPTFTTGLAVGNLPVEEMIFFLMTNTLVAFGVVLMAVPQSRARLEQWLPGRFAARIPGLGGTPNADSKPDPAGR